MTEPLMMTQTKQLRNSPIKKKPSQISSIREPNIEFANWQTPSFIKNKQNQTPN